MPETQEIKEEDQYTYGTIVIDKNDMSMNVLMDSMKGACALGVCNNDCKNCVTIPCG